MEDTIRHSETRLAAELRRVRLGAYAASVVWVLLTALLTVVMSDRVLTSYLGEAADIATRDARTISGVVDRMFHELTLIPRILSSNRDVRAVLVRYNARGAAFADKTAEERGRELQNDPDVSQVNQRLTAVRDNLSYDLVSALNSYGVRIASSEWDRPLPLLGERLEDRDYFKDAMADRPGHQFAVGRTTRVPSLFFSAPVEDEGGVIGVIVVRQDSEAIGQELAGGRHVTFIVDKAGMIVASSRNELTLQHVGALSDTRPDAETLHEIYAQETLRGLAVRRPRHLIHADEWLFEGHPYLLERAALSTPGFSVLVMSPIERLEAVQPLHYAIGALVALFGLLAVRLSQRRADGLAQRRHNLRATAAMNEKLTNLNAEKDRYLGIAAHDLRNPLSSMRGLAELMLETPLEPAQQHEFLDTIRRTSTEMLGLVNDLLDTSVIESGKLELRRSDQDLSKLLRQRIRHLEPPARSKEIAIQVDAADRQRASIDTARFAQVIDNLVSNAIKFSPPGSRVDVALRASIDSFTLSVQDQGPGIAEADRKLLFRSFQKLSARPTGGEKSTGLGLAIVKKIVDAHGGQIAVDDAPGGGTRFIVTIPVVAAAEVLTT